MPPSTTTSLAQWEAQLPTPPQPAGSYIPCVQTDNLVFTSGTLPMKDGAVACTGAVGEGGVSVEAAQEAARLCVLNAMSVLKNHLGSLSRIRKVVKVTGFVNSLPTFTNQPQVMNGASDLLVEIFGEAVGRHARSAVGVAALPRDASVEVEFLVEVSSSP